VRKKVSEVFTSFSFTHEKRAMANSDSKKRFLFITTDFNYCDNGNLAIVLVVI
jgi:hypothetical protein